MVDQNVTAATPVAASIHAREIAGGERFAFGDNWARYLRVLDERKIQRAVDSLNSMLEIDGLAGKSFLDIGSGSGLFSLAARRLGARVFSFDYDPRAVACTEELRRRYCRADKEWEVQVGSVLDKSFLARLGRFDVVYSWGVLHHTGDMWAALANVDGNVAEQGKLFVALANDQGGPSKRWTAIKRMYNKAPSPLRGSFAVMVYAPREAKRLAGSVIRGRVWDHFSDIRNYGENRGMSWWRDHIDWIGGYPFQVSKPEEILDFYRSRGYRLLRMSTRAGGCGCNEYVFKRD